jgi:hypothetical protein
MPLDIRRDEEPDFSPRFSFTIPNKDEFATDMIDMAGASGNIPEEQVFSDNLDQFAMFSVGMTERAHSNTKVWKAVDLKSFMEVKSVLAVAYSSRSGEWADLETNFTIQEPLVLSLFENREDIAHTISQALLESGYRSNILTGAENMGVVTVVALDEKGEDCSRICLWDPTPGLLPGEESAFAIIIDRLSTSDKIASTRNLEKYEIITPLVVETIYKTAQIAVPQMQFSLSPEFEKD